MSTRSCNGRTDSIKYQGFEQSYTTLSLQTTITFQSGKETLMNNIQAGSGEYISGKWRCGLQYEYGRLDNINLKTADGPFWNATLTFSQPLANGIIISSGDDDKPTQNSLNVRIISMPIESHPNYCYIWNHSIATNLDYSETAGWDWPTILAYDSEQAAVWAASFNGRVKWLKDDSLLPTEPATVEEQGQLVQKYWFILHTMTKPGVSTYDMPTYEIQELARHKNRNNATWSLLAKNGKLKFPQYGDFGIENYFFGSADGLTATVSGHWLCEGAGINYDGKYYIATCNYLWSPDNMGWDLDMYEVASGGYYSGSNHNPNSIFYGHMQTEGNVTNPIV